ncbi:MAG: HYR domain-containing protein [Planctomycetes bacterium]|nr:HYR domain-containing protein [Planctomycetota bacterium]
MSCTATDAAGNSSSCSFGVTVVDRTSPVIHCPTDTRATCQGGGAVVTFSATATDLCDAAPATSCMPTSGSTFPRGTTTVTCTAMDASGNSSFCSFSVDIGDVTVTAVLPATGSESGGDLSAVTGCGFTRVGDTSVLLGGAAASVIDVTDSRIRFRTPPGTGVVGVVVTNSNGTGTLSAAYGYVDPVLAARFGNVNVGLGERENVLFVNGTAGDANREITVHVGERLTANMLAPSSRTLARFALYGWSGAPNASTLSLQPSGLGMMVFPSPLTRSRHPQPLAIWNNRGVTQRLGIPNHPSQSAPSLIFNVARGLGNPRTFSFQAIIEDDGSQISQHFSITNAVVLQVVP